MKKKKWLLLSLVCVLMLALAACGGSDSKDKSKGEDTKKEKVDTSKLPFEAKNDGDSIEGGTLKVGLVTDSPFQGIFNWELYEDGNDKDILDYA